MRSGGRGRQRPEIGIATLVLRAGRTSRVIVRARPYNPQVCPLSEDIRFGCGGRPDSNFQSTPRSTRPQCGAASATHASVQKGCRPWQPEKVTQRTKVRSVDSGTLDGL